MKIFRYLSLMLVILVIWTNLAVADLVLEGTLPENPQTGAYPINKFIDSDILGTVTIVDVRTPNEFNAGHLPDAINLPIGSNLNSELLNLLSDKDLVLICAAGRRAAKAYRSFKAEHPELSKNIYFLDANLHYNPTGKITLRPN